MISTTQTLRTIVAGAIVALAASAAQAAPVFTVNPNSNGLTTAGTIFQADAMNGNSSARIVYTGNGTNTFTYSGTGYIDYTAFSLNNAPVSGGISRDNVDYGLYATFQQHFACSSFLAPGVSCAITDITLSLYGDAGNNNSYIAATANSDAQVQTAGTQVLLGTVNKIIAGAAGIDALGGAFQNVNTNFMITDAGKMFFTAPDPFYTFAFSAFNNTSQGLSCNNINPTTGVAGTGCNGLITSLAINNESGITDFNVPEPASLAIFGAGLMGLGFLRRRKA